VQDCEEADLGTQMLGIGRDRTQGLGTGMKEHVVEDLLILIGDGRDRLGHGEHDMEILDAVQQLGSLWGPMSIFRPAERLLGAMAHWPRRGPSP